MQPDVFLPLILAAIAALFGIAAVADAIIEDPEPPEADRRRAARADRSRPGEALLGVGLMMIAAVIGSLGSWRWSYHAAMIGALLVVAGAVLNRRFLSEFLTRRGAARRR